MLKHSTYFNIKWLLIAVLFTATVVFLSHIPEDATPSVLQIGGLDKLAHVSVYGVITFLFVLSLRTSPTMLSALLLFFAILALGAVDELTQPFFSRTASLADWLANVTGIVTVLFSFVCVKNSKRRVAMNSDILPLRPNH